MTKLAKIIEKMIMGHVHCIVTGCNIDIKD